MPTQPFVVPFPIGGVVRRHAYAAQGPSTTPDALNIFPTDWTTGRERGGSRPGLISFGASPSGTPYAWCPVTYQASAGTGVVKGVKRGVAVCTSSGTYVHTRFDDTSQAWTQEIATAPGDDFSTCAMFLQTLVQTSQGMNYPTIKWMAGGDSPWKSVTVPTGNGSLQTVIAGYNSEQGTTYPLPPEYCGIAVIHGDRLVLGGGKNDPHVVYFSAVGNILDWDVASDFTDGAFATSGAGGGTISEPVTALIPHNNDCLLIGGPDSLYVLRGNPRIGGYLFTLSHTTGPLMQSAWCKAGNDYTYMLTREGLWSMRPGCGEPMESVSRESLPDELIGINPGLGHRVCMGYDARFRGIHIYVDKTSSKSGWFYDLQTGGFWPIIYGTGETWSGEAIHLCVEYKATMTSDRTGLTLIKSGGTAHTLDRTDTSESFTSKLWVGPINIGGSPHSEGVLSDIGAVLGEGSDPVSWTAYSGDSPQEAYNSPSYTYTGVDWDRQGLNYKQHPRIRGTSAYVKMTASGTERIQFEELYGDAAPSAARRVD